MKLLVSVAVLCVAIVTLDAAHTTHHPHVTKHHASSNIGFYYDASSHYLIMRKDGSCYFMALTAAEEQSVHNPDSLRTLEIQAMNMHASSSHFAMTGSDHTHISKYVYIHLCQNEHLIKLVQ